MKPLQGQRSCRHCQRSYFPDYRNRHHQHYCSLKECQRASKRASQRRWLGKSANRNYFCGSEHVGRVQRWRHSHPHYWKACHGGGECGGQRKRAENLFLSEESRLPEGQVAGGTLQDFCRVRTPLLLRLVSQLERGTLLEDIVRCASSLAMRKRRLPEPSTLSSRSGGTLCYAAIQQQLRGYARKAELPTSLLSAHNLRRACATHLLAHGASPFALQELLGHERIATLSHYVDQKAEDVKNTHRNSPPGR